MLQATTETHTQYGQQEHGIYYEKLLQQKNITASKVRKSLFNYYINELNNTYNIDGPRT